MMMKKTSSPWMRTKALYVIPVAGIALSAFATSEFTNSVELISESKVNELPEMVQAAGQKTIVEPVQDEPGKVVEVNNELLSGNSNPTDDLLCNVTNLKPEDIAHVTVLKGVSATAIYGEKGANGVIQIETKKVVEKAMQQAVADSIKAVKAVEEADESEVFINCEQMPQFPGGHGELMKFILMNIRYPKLALEYGVKGRVLVQFVVEKDGSVGEHSVLSSKITRPINRTDSMRVAAEQGTMLDEVGNVTINGKAVKTLKVDGKEYKIDQDMVAYQNARIALEEEAVRVLKLMPNWTPGKQRGKVVRVRYTMPIIYRLQ